jgi:DNA (cytosine-5)-methyltransferase 1
MSVAFFMDARSADPMNPSVTPVVSIAPVNISSSENMIRSRPIGVDLFSGVGGMSLGFQQAGFDVVAAVDVEKINIETHKKNFPKCKTWCIDLAKASGKQIRKETGLGNKQIAVVFAGPPCQGFSLIGKRSRLDPRNRLLLELARLIVELAPLYFVVENVAGLLLGNTKKVLDEFVRYVEHAGYSVVKPIQVLDAAEFGVPQRRKRVFILGYRRNAECPVYPIPTHPYSKNGNSGRPSVWDAIGDLPKIANYNYLLETDEYRGGLGKPSRYARVLRGEIADPESGLKEARTNGNGLSGCLRTLHDAKTVRRFNKTKQGRSEEVSRFYRLSKEGLAPTLRAGTGPAQGSFMAPRPIHPFQDRCITVREAARLHSFPDWFSFHATKWHSFRQIGNSVPPLLARAVAKAVLLALRESHQKG